MASEKARALIDTGPLVSFLAAGLKHYSWACDQGRFRKHRLAGEFLKREGQEADLLFELLERGVIRIILNLQKERADLRALTHRYRTGPCRWQMPVWCGFQNCTPTAANDAGMNASSA